MLAISQSGFTYHYLNWVPSERGPLVTNYGSIQKEMENPANIEKYYFDILDEILTVVNNGEPIITFSLDRNQVLFSTCFAEDLIACRTLSKVNPEILGLSVVARGHLGCAPYIQDSPKGS